MRQAAIQCSTGSSNTSHKNDAEETGVVFERDGAPIWRVTGNPEAIHDLEPSWERSLDSLRNQAFTVRREKALVHSGKKDPPGNWIAPPGSNRSSGGGNEAAEASGGKGRIRRLGESAGCNTSER